MAEELERRSILRRLYAGEVRFLGLWAASGFGKSTLARQFAQRYERVLTVDFAGVASASEVASRIAGSAVSMSLNATVELALDRGVSQETWLAYARHVWREPICDLALLENVENAADVDGGEAVVAKTLSATPRPRAIVCCSRRRLELQPSLFAMPHEVYAIREKELAFDIDETQQLLDATPEQAKAVYSLTHGWPLGTRMILRLARESSLDNVLAQVETLEMDALYDYLLEHIVDRMNETSRAYAIALSVIPQPGYRDLEKLFGASAHDLERRALDGGLVALHEGIYDLNPMVRGSIRYRYRDEAIALVQRLAQLWLQDDPIRAATLFLEAGEPEAAATAVEPRALDFLNAPNSPDVRAVYQRIPKQEMLHHPQLWSSAMLYQGLSLPPQQRLDEALYVWERLPSTSTDRTRLCVASELIDSLSNVGRFEEAEALYERCVRAIESGDREMSVLRALCAIRLYARQGRFLEALPMYEEAREAIRRQPDAYSIAIGEMDLRLARARGNWPEERTWQDAALSYARESKNPLSIAHAFMESIFGAWFADDDERFNDLLQQFDDFRTPSISLGTSLFRDCALGRLDALVDGNERPQIRAYAYLIALSAAHGPQRLAMALRAAAAADASRQPLVQTIARVAIAAIDPAGRSVHLELALRSAERIDVRELREAVAALQRGEVPKLFAGMTSRLTHGSADLQRYRLVIAEQTLHRGRESIELTKREAELLCFLGTRQRGVSLGVLAEAMMPEKDSPSASQALRTLVARVRKKCGDGVIVLGKRGYRLGCDVQVASQEIARRIAAAALQAQLDAGELAALRRDLATIRSWLREPLPPWEWAEESEEQLCALKAMLLARLRREAEGGAHEIDESELSDVG